MAKAAGLRSSRQVRSRGRWVAAGFAVAGAAALGYFVATRPATTEDEADPSLPSSDLLGGRGDVGTTDGGRVRLLMVDEQEPTRVMGVMSAASFRPESRSQYRVTEPHGTYYLRDGRVATVRADEGVVIMPTRDQPPERGRLIGHVVVRLFVPARAGAPVDPAVDRPDLEIVVHEPVDFDMTQGTLATSGLFEVRGTVVRGRGTGLSLAIDEISEQVSHLVIDRGGQFVVDTSRDRAGGTAQADAAGSGATSPGAGAAGSGLPPEPSSDEPATAVAQAQPPRESRYHIVAVEDARVSLRGRGQSATARGLRLDAWVRLVGNKLPEGTIAPIVLPAAPDQPRNAATQTVATEATSAELAHAEGAATAEANAAAPGTNPGVVVASEPGRDEVEIRWGGRLVLTALAEVPQQLDRDHVSVAISSPSQAAAQGSEGQSQDPSIAPEPGPGFVTLADSQGGRGFCGSIAYGTSTRRLWLEPASAEVVQKDARGEPADGEHWRRFGMEFTSPTHGSVLARAATLDLGSAEARIQGPAVARLADGATALWSEHALARLVVDGPHVRGVRSFQLAGDAQIDRAEGGLRAAHVEGTLATAPDGRVVIESLKAQGRFGSLARAFDLRQGWLDAERIEATFDPDRSTAGATIARLVRATGRVVGERSGGLSMEGTGPGVATVERLRAGELVARFEPGSAEDRSVRSVLVGVDLREQASFARVERESADATEQAVASAWADAIAFDPIVQRAVLESTSGQWAWASTRGKGGITRIEGPLLSLDAGERTVWSFGPGVLVDRADSSGIERLRARWSSELRLDDRVGSILAVGDVDALARSVDGLSEDRMVAHRVEATVDRAAAGADRGAREGGRELRSARMEAASVHVESDRKASLTSKRYAADGADGMGERGEPRLEQLVYLEAVDVRVRAEPASVGSMDEPIPDERGEWPAGVERGGLRVSVPGPGRLLVVDGRSQPAGGEDVGEADLRSSVEGQRVDGSGRALFDWMTSMDASQTLSEMRMVGGVRVAHVRPSDARQTTLDAERVTASLGKAGAGTGGGLRRAEASGSVLVRSRGSDGVREAQADHAEYNAIEGTAVLQAHSGRTVRSYEPGRGGVIEAAEIFWDLARDRIQILRPGTMTGSGR